MRVKSSTLSHTHLFCPIFLNVLLFHYLLLYLYSLTLTTAHNFKCAYINIICSGFIFGPYNRICSLSYYLLLSYSCTLSFDNLFYQSWSNNILLSTFLFILFNSLYGPYFYTCCPCHYFYFISFSLYLSFGHILRWAFITTICFIYFLSLSLTHIFKCIVLTWGYFQRPNEGLVSWVLMSDITVHVMLPKLNNNTHENLNNLYESFFHTNVINHRNHWG